MVILFVVKRETETILLTELHFTVGVFDVRFMDVFFCRPVESHSGARETILAGPYHKLIL